MRRFEYTDDVSSGDWIGPRMRGWGTVTGMVPGGFEAYARIFHPVPRDRLESSSDPDTVAGRIAAAAAASLPAKVSWRYFCELNGRQWHPLMQFMSIASDDVQAPYGSLGVAGWAELARAIAADDASADPAGNDIPVTVGFWTGSGSIAAPGETPTSVSVLMSRPDDAQLEPRQEAAQRAEADYANSSEGMSAHGHITSWPVDVRSGPLLELPGREYALFTGGLDVFLDPEWPRASGWAFSWDETVNLAWPSDHSWFVASEVDLDSTIIGGTRPLIERVLASGLEAAEVPSDADLGWHGDTLNGSTRPESP